MSHVTKCEEKVLKTAPESWKWPEKDGEDDKKSERTW